MAAAKTWLILGYLLAGGWGLYEYIQGPRLPALDRNTAAKARPEPPISVKVPSVTVGSYNEILERPLFYAGRQQPAEPVAVGAVGTQQTDSAPVSATELADMRLTAVFLGGEEPLAMFENRSGSVETLKAGEELAGWRVEQIDEAKVVLSYRGRSKTFDLYQYPAPVAKKPAPPGRQVAGRQRPRKPEYFRQPPPDRNTRRKPE